MVGDDHIGCSKTFTVCDKHSFYPGCNKDPDYKYEVEAPDKTQSCEYYGLPKRCYFYIDPLNNRRYAYYYPNKYMNWVEEYNRLDYQLKEKDKDKDKNKEIKDIIKDEKKLAKDLK